MGNITHATPKSPGDKGLAAEWNAPHNIPDDVETTSGKALLKDGDPISISDIDVLLRTLLRTLGNLARDSSDRLRIIIDAAGTATPVTASGNWDMRSLTYIGSATYALDVRYSMADLANAAFAQAIRPQLVFS